MQIGGLKAVSSSWDTTPGSFKLEYNCRLIVEQTILLPNSIWAAQILTPNTVRFGFNSLCTRYIRDNGRFRTKQTCTSAIWWIQNFFGSKFWRLLIVRKSKSGNNDTPLIMQRFYQTPKGAFQPSFFFQARPPFEPHYTVFNLCPWRSQINLLCDFLPVTASGCVFTALTATGRQLVSYIHYKVNRNLVPG